METLAGKLVDGKKVPGFFAKASQEFVIMAVGLKKYLILMWPLAFLAMLSSCSSSPQPSAKTSQKHFAFGLAKYALLVSVNDYAPGSDTAKLRGPKNDMDGLSEVLTKRFAFNQTGILRLHGETATRAKILAGLKEMVALAAPDRILVFGFAGHGAVYQDMGDDEANGWDEAICPYDRKDILDDHLQQYYSQILEKGAHLIIFMDACFSGGNFMNLPGKVTVRQTKPNHQAPILPSTRGYLNAKLGQHKNLVFWASATEEEPAVERFFEASTIMSEGYQGLFSYYLLKNLKTVTPQWSWQDFQQALVRDVRVQNMGQTPRLLGGGIQKMLFETVATIEANHFRITAIDDGRITVLAGTMSGVDSGAILAIYPRGSEQHQTPSKFELWRVFRADPHRAEARPIAEATTLPTIDAIAVLHQPAELHQPHRLFLDEDLPESFKSALMELAEENRQLQLASVKAIPSPRDFVFEVQDPRRIYISGPPAPFLVELEEPGFIGVSALESACRKIANIAYQEFLLAIDNHHPNALKVKDVLGIRLVRGSFDENAFGESSFVPSNHQDPGNRRFREGEAICLELENRTTRSPFFVTVFFLSNDGGVFAWNANTYDSLLRPGLKVIDDRLLLKITPPFGLDRIKVFVNTLRPFDPNPFLQSKALPTFSDRDGVDAWGTQTLELHTFPK